MKGDRAIEILFYAAVLASLLVSVLLFFGRAEAQAEPTLAQSLNRIADQLEPISLAAARINYLTDEAITLQSEGAFDFLAAIEALMQLEEINKMLAGLNVALAAVPAMDAKMGAMANHMGRMTYQMDKAGRWVP